MVNLHFSNDSNELREATSCIVYKKSLLRRRFESAGPEMLFSSRNAF
jgi:hypothetical protein